MSKREERFNVFLLKEGRAVSRSNKFLFSLLFFLLIPISIFSKVIITHGVLGNDSDWYKPGGYFYEAVSESAKKLDQSVDTFSWTQDLGGITHYERIKAGIKLAKQIVDNKVAGEKEIILIGHSYGGHVIKVASQLLSFAQIPSFSEEQQEPEEVVSQEIEEIVPEEKIDETEEALEEILTEEEPVIEQPIIEEPVAEEPVAEEPITEEPIIEEPVTIPEENNGAEIPSPNDDGDGDGDGDDNAGSVEEITQ